MQLKQLFADDRAVSPVIGVILMVAITVILAAIIGTFVLGLGDSVQTSGPTADFQFQYESSSPPASVTLTHTSGQDVTSANIKVTGSDSGSLTATGGGFPTKITAGDSATYDNGGTALSSGETIRVVWSSPNGGSSSTIAQSEVPS